MPISTTPNPSDLADIADQLDQVFEQIRTCAGIAQAERGPDRSRAARVLMRDCASPLRLLAEKVRAAAEAGQVAEVAS